MQELLGLEFKREKVFSRKYSFKTWEILLQCAVTSNAFYRFYRYWNHFYSSFNWITRYFWKICNGCYSSKSEYIYILSSKLSTDNSIFKEFIDQLMEGRQLDKNYWDNKYFENTTSPSQAWYDLALGHPQQMQKKFIMGCLNVWKSN